MAGQRIEKGLTTCRNGMTGGLLLVTIIENGSVEPGDEWALFRLTDDGLSFIKEGSEFRAGISSVQIGSYLAVVELVPRYKTKQEAEKAKAQLPEDERERTLVRRVKPSFRLPREIKDVRWS